MHSIRRWKMKVIIIGTAYPYRSKVSVFNHNLARQLMADGNDVEIITYRYDGMRSKKLSGDSSPENLKITQMINSISPMSWRKTANYIKKSLPDEVIFAYTDSRSSVCMGNIAQKLNVCSQIKRIAIVKDIIPDNANVLDRFLPYKFARNVDGFVCVNKGIAEDIEHFEKKPKPKKYSNMPINVPYGERIPRDMAIDELSLDPNCRYLLFFGYIRPYKGLDLLIDALADARLRKYNVKLLVAGEFKDNIQMYIDKIREANVGEFLEMRTEYINNRDVNKYFSAADMVVQTYKKPKESGVTQMAYHFEKPMLVTNMEKLADIVPNGVVGYVVEPNAKDIADAIVDFYENDRREDFERNVVVEKQKFSWVNLTKTIETLFD
ncbi:MAG: glycosyltransferase [Bacteroidales bacterium]|nr:glycosyltransferase [Bacteroidales bacterium]MBQ1730870.1 glycosyltransferase [Bacteroidales bacterium]MBQ2076926.1 glycosyltransferase [Bacteroidales bacterium]MBQ2352022.1 glycosyltransferase [Bacteroidales bacterium]MBQ2574630.1 glycosyltransferase [Bacteroidales bacterium]